MRAIDTNVLVRLLARDDPKQLASAETFVQTGAWVSLLVLMETVWVLDSVYEIQPGPLADGVEMLLDHKQLVVQDADLVKAALEKYRKHPELGFSECLILQAACAAGHVPLGTFDRRLAKLKAAHKL